MSIRSLYKASQINYPSVYGDNAEDALDGIIAGGSKPSYPGGLTDPALNSISQSMVDNYGSVGITLTTTGNNQTMPAPTDTSQETQFMVINNSSSTDPINIIGASTTVLQPGWGVKLFWNKTEWVAIGDWAFSFYWQDDSTDLSPANARGLKIQNGAIFNTSEGDNDFRIKRYNGSGDDAFYYNAGADTIWIHNDINFFAAILRTDAINDIAAAGINIDGLIHKNGYINKSGSDNTGITFDVSDNLILKSGGVDVELKIQSSSISGKVGAIRFAQSNESAYKVGYNGNATSESFYIERYSGGVFDAVDYVLRGFDDIAYYRSGLKFGVGTQVPVSNFEVNGSVGKKVITKSTTPYTLANTDYTLIFDTDTAAANMVANLLDATTAYNSIDDVGRIYNIKNIGTSGYKVTIDAYLTQEIDGNLTVDCLDGENYQIQSDGYNWIIL